MGLTRVMGYNIRYSTVVQVYHNLVWIFTYIIMCLLLPHEKAMESTLIRQMSEEDSTLM